MNTDMDIVLDVEEKQPTQPKIPKRVFIVPYRDRQHHKYFFQRWMSYILEDDNEYEIYFSHQTDNRSFNRGAARNIGFLAVKDKYPKDYQNITFIFNDIDTMPFNKIFDYDTSLGVVKHYYGFTAALGGIVVMKGYDFERINGYPCFWGWGMEDNCLQKRCNTNKLYIDRTSFYPIGSPEILQLFDGVARIINPRDPSRMINDVGVDGLFTITNLSYEITDEDPDVNDSFFSFKSDTTDINSRIFYINIEYFDTYVPFNINDNYMYDLRDPKEKTYRPDAKTKTSKTYITGDEWVNIPNKITHQAKVKHPQQQNQQKGYSAGLYSPGAIKSSVNVFSPEYAALIGEKPKATSSIPRLPLGGLGFSNRIR